MFTWHEVFLWKAKDLLGYMVLLLSTGALPVSDFWSKGLGHGHDSNGIALLPAFHASGHAVPVLVQL
jgi:hypothetical protein